MKKYILYFITFIIIFIITFILLFPYNTLSKYLLNKYIFLKYKNIVSYQNIDSNIERTKITNIHLYIDDKPFNIKSIIINHNPIKLCQKEISIYVNPLKLILFLKKDDQQILYRANWRLDTLTHYMKDKIINGLIHINGNFNYVNKIGIIHLNSNNLSLKDKTLNLNLKHIVGNISINRNKVTIKELSAQGSPRLDIKGSIILNSNYISMSPINIRIKVSYPYMTKYITISGTLYNPQIIY